MPLKVKDSLSLHHASIELPKGTPTEQSATVVQRWDVNCRTIKTDLHVQQNCIE